LLAEPVALRYELNYQGSEVTFDDPEEYIRLAEQALLAASRRASESGHEVDAIGICSQAQTFIAVDEFGGSIAPAIVWLDARAAAEAEELTPLIPDYAVRSGFPKPSAQQFLCKVFHDSRHSRACRSCFKLLLLNEFVVSRLTPHAYGDTTLQAMGGFYDIAERKWSDDLISLAGIRKRQLAPTFPAASVARRACFYPSGEEEIPPVPVYSCGNDQCCSAIGAGVTKPGEVVCNFGTAMVVYTLQETQPMDIKENQIAGIDPLTDGYFLLGYESDCGNLIDRAHRDHYPDITIDEMIENPESQELRALLQQLSQKFWYLLKDLTPSPGNARLIASGGLSRSHAWLRFLEEAHGIRFERAPHEHSSLLGIAKVIERQRKNANGA
jgi:sugar (pentulose or hexulose) kinase